MKYIIRRQELYHHGIPGQRWGQRNGPPYPLGSDDYSPREKAAKEKFHLSDKQKKYLKIGLAVAGTALAVYGAYKLGAFDRLRYASTQPLKEASAEIKLSDLDRKIEEVVSGVNPLYESGDLGASMNCGNVALAIEQRFRGINSEARLNETGMTQSSFISFFKNMTSDNIIEDVRFDAPDDEIERFLWFSDGNNIANHLKSSINDRFPDGSRGSVFFPGEFGSHWFSWIKDGNSVKFIDGQSGNKADLTQLFSTYKYYPKNTRAALNIYRLDNLEFSDRIESVVKEVNGLNISKYQFDTFIDEGETFITNWRENNS